MTGYLIYNKKEAARNSFFIGELIKEGQARLLDISLILEEDLSPGICSSDFLVTSDNKKLKKPDFVIARSQNYILSKHFEYMGVRVFNTSKVCRICNDKMQTYQLAASLDIPIMETRLITCKNSPASPFFPCVIKPTGGKGGENVFMAHDMGEYEKIISSFPEKYALVQKCASTLGRDSRIYVMGGEIICAFTRISKGDFRSNFCLGGQAEPHTPTRAERLVVEKLCKALKPDYVGIDFVYNDGEPIFNEIEDAVGARMVYTLSDINIAAMYVKYIKDTIGG